MKITIKKRNRIVEEYLWCIDRVIRQNWHLIEAAHLDRDDVYQDLAIRLIRAVAGVRPQKRKAGAAHPLPAPLRTSQL